MERKLLLLGLLRSGGAHGYHIMEMLDLHAGMSISLKTPTAYRLLDEMMHDGWLTCREEKKGKRPARKVYELTPEGEHRFFSLLKECLGRYHSAEYRHDISLIFMSALEPMEAAKQLTARLSAISELVDSRTEAAKTHGGSTVLAHQVRHLQLDRDYIRDMLKTINDEGEIPHG